MHSMKDSDQPIVYKFSMGTTVNRTLKVIDMAGKERFFHIIINDEQGVTSCVPIAEN